MARVFEPWYKRVCEKRFYLGRTRAMGEAYTIPGCTFNRSVRIEARPERLTGDAGAIVLREVAERLGYLDLLASTLEDPRDPRYVVHPWRELLATALLLPALGWRDQDDADKLRDDPALRLSVSTRRGTRPLEPAFGSQERLEPSEPEGLASQPTLSRMVGAVSSERNRGASHEVIPALVGARLRAFNSGHRLRYATVDIDHLPVEVQGHQVGACYNGYYRKVVYLPIVASIAETGDIVDVVLREGRSADARESLDFILPLLDRMEKSICQVASVRFDAAFPSEELLSGLEKRSRPVAYVGRLRNNETLDRMAAGHLVLPAAAPGQEPRTFMHEKIHKAGPWSRHRRVILVVQERPAELFPHYFWLVTSWASEDMDAAAVLEHYRRRGTAEGHMGELMDVLAPALSSVRRPKRHVRGKPPKKRTDPRDSFASNEAILLLSVLSYNLMHATRTLLEKATRSGWALRRVREMILRVAARVLIHSRRVHVVVARSAAPLWRKLWHQIAAFNPAFVT